MWSVLETRKSKKELDRAPLEVQESFEAWKLIVIHQGPIGLRQINGYWDHALKGEWKGARASYLNKQWRVIYIFRGEQVQVIVASVTPHDYRKKL